MILSGPANSISMRPCICIQDSIITQMSRAEQFHFTKWQENYHVPEICTALIISPFIHVMDNHFYRLLHTVKWFGGSSRRIWAFSLLKYTLINHNVLPASSFISLLQMYLSFPPIRVPTYSHSSLSVLFSFHLQELWEEICYLNGETIYLNRHFCLSVTMF